MKVNRKIRDNKVCIQIWKAILSCATIISPELNSKMYYRISQGKPLNLSFPKDFNEKVLWLKLNTYLNDPLVRQCADKYAVREYVKEKGWGETLTPLLAVYTSVDEIKKDNLPDRFALKLNYGCGFNILCTDKNTFDLDRAKQKLRKWMRSSYYLPYSEMQYKEIEKRILLEQFIENDDGMFPDDYKFYCYDGEPLYLLYCTDRVGECVQKTMYDIDGKVVPYKEGCVSKPFRRPACYDQMLEVCRKLAKGFPFVRVDLYDSDGKVVFGELTFTPAGGTGKYTPEGSIILGEKIKTAR